MSRFLPGYTTRGIIDFDPFVTINTKGVGKLVEMATVANRAASRDVKVGVCGEHGGYPASVAFFHSIDLDHVSCSPLMIPIACPASAHAVADESD